LIQKKIYSLYFDFSSLIINIFLISATQYKKIYLQGKLEMLMTICALDYFTRNSVCLQAYIVIFSE